MIGDSKVFPTDEFLHRDLIKNVVINYLRGIATGEGIKLIRQSGIRIRKLKQTVKRDYMKRRFITFVIAFFLAAYPGVLPRKHLLPCH